MALLLLLQHSTMLVQCSVIVVVVSRLHQASMTAANTIMSLLNAYQHTIAGAFIRAHYALQTKEKQLKAFYEGAADGQPVSFKGVPEHTDEHGVKRAYTAAVLFFLAVMTCIR
jgi:hypothetical protein